MSKIIDISQKVCPEMAVYPGDPRYQTRTVCGFKLGDMCEVSELTMGSHCGTHIDAPLHMIPDGAGIDTMPLDCFYGPCRVLTIGAAVVTEKMLEDLSIEPGERILLRTDPAGKYAGSNRFNPTVLSMRAAQYLAQLHVKLVGIDAPTVENMELCDGEIHRALLSAGVAILEGVCLKDAVKERYTLSALPLNLIGENGAPCRAVLIDEEA
ncbi:MAG: cyclase family protein [Clostridiales bacterium]|nr:cyclase family protein [Clostridiales bacterium]